jgi:hypothetical protein
MPLIVLDCETIFYSCFGNKGTMHDGGTIRNIAAELDVTTSTVLRAGLFSTDLKILNIEVDKL